MTMQDFIDGNIAIYCETEAESKQVLLKCREHGLKWRSGANADELPMRNFPNEIVYGFPGNSLFPNDQDFLGWAGADCNSGFCRGFSHKRLHPQQHNEDNENAKQFLPVDAIDFLIAINNQESGRSNEFYHSEAWAVLSKKFNLPQEMTGTEETAAGEITIANAQKLQMSDSSDDLYRDQAINKLKINPSFGSTIEFSSMLKLIISELNDLYRR